MIRTGSSNNSVVISDVVATKLATGNVENLQLSATGEIITGPLPFIKTGTYKPVYAEMPSPSKLDSVIHKLAIYYQINDLVTVYGAFMVRTAIDLVMTSPKTVIVKFNVPINSTFKFSFDCMGSSSSAIASTGVAVIESGIITADTSIGSNSVFLRFILNRPTNTVINYNFSYQVK